MDKTLGQIAFEARPCAGPWGERWEDYCGAEHQMWESVGAAVAAAVKEEDARICEAWGNECHGEGRDDSEAFDCADHIRASIKEVK